MGVEGGRHVSMRATLMFSRWARPCVEYIGSLRRGIGIFFHRSTAFTLFGREGKGMFIGHGACTMSTAHGLFGGAFLLGSRLTRRGGAWRKAKYALVFGESCSLFRGVRGSAERVMHVEPGRNGVYHKRS